MTETQNEIRNDFNREREDQSRKRGVARAKKRREAQEKRGDMSSTTAGMMTSERCREAVADVISLYLEQELPKKKKAFWYEHVNYHPVEKTAELALRCCLDAVGANWTRNNLILQLANALNSSILNEVLKRTQAGRRILTDIANRVQSKPGATYTKRDRALWIAGQKKKKTVLDADGNQFAVDDEKSYYWREWDKKTATRVGGIMLKAVFESTDLFENDHIKDEIEDKQKHIKLKLTPAAQAQMSKLQDFLDQQTPQFGPMFNKPYPWGPDSMGPYDSVSLARQVPPVKHMGEAQEKAVWEAIRNGSMDDCLEALNTLQDVPYTVNETVVEAVRWVMNNGLAAKVGSFPNLQKATELPDIPKKEFDKWAVDARMDYGREQLAILKGNREVDANLLGIKRNLDEAKNVQTAKDEGVEGFYLPHQWDYRGRVYHTSEFGHHNTDYLRAMFMFANKDEITNDNAPYLTLQLANTYGNGVDKLTLEERQQWAVDNEDIILAIGKDFKDPVAFAFWSVADEPFQFLAACTEWYRATENPGYKTGLPIALDATQSGIQVYAAMARSQPDGEKVNLTQNTEPGDLYTEVMVVANDIIAQDIAELDWLDDEPEDEDDEDRAKERRKLKHARQVQAHGLDRKTVKRNAMTWAYSSRRYGFAEQLRSDMMEPLSKQVRRGELAEHPFGADRGYGAAWYLAGVNETAIRRVIRSAGDGMDFFQWVVGLCNDADMHLTYTTPLGFPVHQCYQELYREKVMNKKTGKEEWQVVSERIEMPGWDRDYNRSTTLKTSFRNYTDDVDTRQSRQAVAPNMVHSLDATVLMKTVLLMREHGALDLMTVHDSFSTTIGNVGVMSASVRQAFYDTFADYCPYTDLLNQTLARLSERGIDLPENPHDEIPEPGTLDLSEVLKSDYAFS